MSVLLVGAGRMARAYAIVLQELAAPVTAVGRGEESAAAFEEETGVAAETGGLGAWLERTGDVPAQAIVAVPVDELAPATHALLEAGVGRILVEKPGGVDTGELRSVAEAAAGRGATVLVAYNRRFYESTRRARELIAEDGGVTSFGFEFTELSDVIAESPISPRVKEHWFLANSTHVVDLAFFLGGKPASLEARVAGSLSWHPSARFAGSGETAGGALFGYQADWDAPGRWGVELMTRNRRIVLRPLEELRVQERGAFDVERIDLDDELDRRFKPGLYRQTEAFLADPPDTSLPDIAEQAETSARIYDVIASGGTL